MDSSKFFSFFPSCLPGGSWSTCMYGANQTPPQDVAHIQFQSRIAFKLVWSPPTFDSVRPGPYCDRFALCYT